MRKKAQRFTVTSDNEYLDIGAIVQLVEDDGTFCPWFKVVKGKVKHDRWNKKHFAFMLDWLTPEVTP